MVATLATLADCLTMGAMVGILFGGWLVCIAFPRRAAETIPPRPRARHALTVGRLVEINAGDHRGLCGWVRYLWIDAHTGAAKVTIELNGGAWVAADRADVSPA